jgi:hypothetical protein
MTFRDSIFKFYIGYAVWSPRTLDSMRNRKNIQSQIVVINKSVFLDANYIFGRSAYRFMDNFQKEAGYITCSSLVGGVGRAWRVMSREMFGFEVVFSQRSDLDVLIHFLEDITIEFSNWCMLMTVSI